jgi:photosystem II stability/assembly factor-like uncharacterized protein
MDRPRFPIQEAEEPPMRTSTLPLALAAILVSAASPALSATQDLDALAWRELGPSTFSGRIVDIAVHAAHPGELLVASATGGLWWSGNLGTTWTCLFQDEGTISIGDVAWDPRDADVMWVGTGEANNQRSSYWGDGIYRTEDGGDTWTNMGLPESHHIGRIVIHPEDSRVVYVAVLGRLYTPNPERGLYKTEDGGATWRKVLYVNEDVGVVDVVVDPRDGDIVYAASYERRRRAWDFDGAGPGSAIHKSTDGGLTWERLAGGLPDGEIGRIGLALYAGDPDVVYATVSNQNQVEVRSERDPGVGLELRFRDGELSVRSVAEGSGAEELGLQRGDVLVALGDEPLVSSWSWLKALAALESDTPVKLVYRRGDEQLDVEATRAALERVVREEPRRRTVGGEVYRSNDAGATWTRVNEGAVGGNPAYYYGQIRVDPRDDQSVVVLGIPVQASKDGGKTWGRNLAGPVHVDHHAFEFCPHDPRRIYLGNDGGLAISHDAGATWDHYDNLPLAQLYAVGLDMRTPFHVYGGTQDNGTWGGPSRSRNPRGIGVDEWYRIGGGDGFYAQVDPADADTVYGESQFGALYRRDVGRGSTTAIRPARTEPEGAADRYNWNSPILISHHNPQIVYFGGNRLFKSYDRGDHWPVVSEDLTTADPDKLAGNVPHCTLTTIAESPRDPNLLLVGSDDGLVHVSEDGGLSWTNLAGRFPGAPSNWWVSRCELSHHARDTAYVTLTGYREDDFRPFAYKTTDLGRTWNRIDAGLPVEPINVIKEDPRNAQLLYCGTELGVYASLDGGASWARLGAGLPRIAVHDLAVHPRDGELILATHGRGFWATDVSGLQGLDAAARARDAALLPIADVLRMRSQSDTGSGSRRWYGENPRSAVALFVHVAADLPSDALGLRIEDAAGELQARLDVSREAGLQRVEWNLRRQGEGGARGGGAGRRRQGRGGGGAGLVAPGTYTAVLRVGEDEQRRTFRVLSDPLD